MAAVLSAGPAWPDSGSEQWWTEFAHKFPGGRRAIVAVTSTARVAEGFEVNTWNLEVDYLLKAGSRSLWGPGFKFQEARQPGGEFEKEDRYLLTGEARLGPAPWKWKPDLRGIYEYRKRETRADSWRFRLRPGVKRAIGSSGWIFVGQDEVFYDSAEDRIDQNRLRVGGEHHLRGSPKATVLVYFLLRSDRAGDSWVKTDVLGSSWTF